MLAQAVPIGINISSPVTWFVIAIAFVVLALTVSTRRSNARPRAGVPTVVQRLATVGRAGYLAQWSAAQALFIEDPRAGLMRAQATVREAAREYGRDAFTERARAVAEREDATTEEMREALLDLRATLDSVLGPPKSGATE